MKKFNFIASIAVLMFASCTDKNEIFNNVGDDNNIVQTRTSPIVLDGYLTLSNPDSIQVGDPICDFLKIDDYENMRPALRSSIAGNSDNGLDGILDFPINIIVRESNSSARYLTHQGLNKELILKDYDANNTVYSTFYLQGSIFTGYYLQAAVPTVTFVSPLKITNERKPIDACIRASIPNIKTLYVVDHNTNVIGTTWDICPSQRNLGDNSGAYIFNDGGWPTCLQSENTNLRFGEYMMRGTQEFIIHPIEDFDMVSLKFIADNSSLAVRMPDFIDNWDYNNNTDADQNMSTNFTKKATNSTSFTRKNSISLTIGTILKVGIPLIASGQITTNTSSSFEWTYGQSGQTEDTRTYNFPIMINKRTRVFATIYVFLYKMDLKYEAVFKGQTTGKYFTEIGDWQGVNCVDIKVNVQQIDTYGNTQTLTFDGVPTERVVFPNIKVPNGGLHDVDPAINVDPAVATDVVGDAVADHGMVLIP